MNAANPPAPGAPGFADIEAAAERILPYAHRTPVMTCRSIDDWIGARVWMKCENLQKTGAFKFRGAVNALSRLAHRELPS